jgi:hypothetical protein
VFAGLSESLLEASFRPTEAQPGMILTAPFPAVLSRHYHIWNDFDSSEAVLVQSYHFFYVKVSIWAYMICANKLKFRGKARRQNTSSDA